MEQPSSPETLPNILHIPPRTHRVGPRAQRCPSSALREHPEPQPTTSTTRGTWTSSMCLTRACLGKKIPICEERARKGWSQHVWVALINHKKISTCRFIESSHANGQAQNIEMNSKTDKPVYRELKSRCHDQTTCKFYKTVQRPDPETGQTRFTHHHHSQRQANKQSEKGIV